MPAYPPGDPLSNSPHLAAEPDRDFWMNGLGFGGFLGVMNLGAGFDEAWKRAFGSGENRRIADELMGAHGTGRNVRRNLLLAAGYVENTDVDAVGDVARAVLGDASVPDENERRFCRNGLAARILAKSPAGLLGVRALDDFAPRRHYALALDGRAAPPGALADLDWTEIVGRALDGMKAARCGLNLRACVVRAWRSDVVLAFREPGRSSPNWKPDKPFEFQLGNKHEWTWVRLLDGAHRAQVAGHDPERAVEVASAVATAIWRRPRTYEWAHDPLTPESLRELHEALINPKEDKFRLLEVVAEMPGLHDRPILKLGNKGQVRVERALAELWDAGIGFALDPAHVLRAKVSFEHKRRRYRIELHYPEDALADKPVVGFGTSGVHPDVAGEFVALVQRELGVTLNPRSPADARTSAWRERPAVLTAADWDRLLAPTLLAPAKWEHDELAALARKGVVTVARESVFRCGSPAILKRARQAPDGCTGSVIGEYGAVSKDVPFEQGDGPALVCDRCGAHWPRRQARLPWHEQARVTLNEDAAWDLAVAALKGRAKGASRAMTGVLAWYDSEPCEVVSVHRAASERLKVNSGAGRCAAWFGASASAVAKYGDRGVRLAELLADGEAAFARVYDLGPLPGKADVLYLREPPPAMYGSGGPRIGSPTHKGIVQRGDDGGAYLHQRVVVKPAHAKTILVLAALQRATEDASDPDDGRRWHPAEDLAAIINDELRALNGGRALGAAVADADIHTWVRRARDAITAANVPAVTGPEVIEEGNKKGIRLGARFRLDGFSVQDEARRYNAGARARGTAKET